MPGAAPTRPSIRVSLRCGAEAISRDRMRIKTIRTRSPSEFRRIARLSTTGCAVRSRCAFAAFGVVLIAVRGAASEPPPWL
jgi:hypothetical protein